MSQLRTRTTCCIIHDVVTHKNNVAACPQVRTASCAGTACVNSFGDEQLAVDMLADKLLFEALRYSGVCKYACSEEVPEAVDMGGEVRMTLLL